MVTYWVLHLTPLQSETHNFHIPTAFTRTTITSNHLLTSDSNLCMKTQIWDLATITQSYSFVLCCAVFSLNLLLLEGNLNKIRLLLCLSWLPFPWPWAAHVNQQCLIFDFVPCISSTGHNTGKKKKKKNLISGNCKFFYPFPAGCWKTYASIEIFALQKTCSKFSNQSNTDAKAFPTFTPCSNLKDLSLHYPAVYLNL